MERNNPVLSGVPLDVEEAIYVGTGRLSTGVESDTNEGSVVHTHTLPSIDADIIERIGDINLDLLTEKKLDSFLIELLIRQITYGLPGTNGSFWSNVFAYILTEHDLLSIFLTHPLDPFTRYKRVVYFYITFVFLLSMTQVFSQPDGDGHVVLGIIASVLVEPVKFILRRAIECPCIRLDACIYRWICCCVHGRSGEFRETILKGADFCAWVLLLFFALGSTVVTTFYILARCLEAPDDGEPSCVDFVDWLSGQAFSLLFTSVCVLVFYVYWNFSSHKERFKNKVEEVFGISRAYQEAHNIVSLTSLARLVLTRKGDTLSDVEIFKMMYKMVT